jgi:hypothetical protein
MEGNGGQWRVMEGDPRRAIEVKEGMEDKRKKKSRKWRISEKKKLTCDLNGCARVPVEIAVLPNYST